MFITFEGIEGSGKSTALKRLCEALDRGGCSYLRTREPGGSELGTSLRALLLDANREVAPEAELFMYLADRAQHVAHVIKPALKEKKLVLSDRYADSTIVYQGYGRRMDVKTLFKLNEIAITGLWPDLTILFDIDPKLGLDRAKKRNEEQGIDISEGRFEAEKMSFHRTIRQGYLEWAKEHSYRFRIIDASASIDAVFEQLVKHLKGRVFLP